MARRYGSNISSLVNAARSAYEKQQSLNDQIAAYEWDLSAKTAEDADKYMKYIKTRQGQVQSTDPSKALSFQQKLTSVQRAFSSAEISRASLAINYGQGSDADKYNKITQLRQNAIANGDEALAARLESQAATLQIKMQNAASAGAGKAYTAMKNGIDSEIRQGKQAMDIYQKSYKAGEMTKEQYVNAITATADALNAAYLKASNDGSLKEEDRLKYQQEAFDNQMKNQKIMGKEAAILKYRPDLVQQGSNAAGDTTVGNAPIIGYDRVVTNDKAALAAKAYDSQYNPLTGKVEQQLNDAAGSTVGQIAAGPVDRAGALKKLGVGNTSGRYFNPLTNEYNQYEVFANDYNNPQYAYTKDAKGIFYLVNKDGTLTPMKDVNQANTSTVEVAKDQLAAYRDKNGFAAPGTHRMDTLKYALGGIPGLIYGQGRALSNLLGVSEKLRARAEAKRQADIAEGKRLYAEQQAALKAAQQAQAARNAKIAQSAKKDYWSAAPYRDQPLIANPKNGAEVAYNIGSQTGLKIPKLP